MAVMLALVMVLGSFSAVFADDNKTITLENGKAGHTYTLYQILVGDVNAENELQLDNIQWGNGVTDAFKASKGTAAAYAKDIADANDARATARELVYAGALQNGKAVTMDADGPVVFSGLAEGYYIVVDENGNTEAVDGDFSSEYIVQVVNNVSMELKGQPTTAEKKVLDTEDMNVTLDVSELKNVDGDWQDSADHDFGDAVPFKLTANLANNVQSYAKYHVTLEDKQAAGFDAPTKWYVTVLDLEFEIDNTTTTASKKTANGTIVTVTKSVPAGKTFAIKVELEQENPVTAEVKNPANPDETMTVITSNLADGNSAVVTVKYTSVLNRSANIGKTGNLNELVCKYSNNPEERQEGKAGEDEGETPEDYVKVFTYKTEVDKVDETGAALKGAVFTLYKEVLEDAEGAVLGSEIKKGFGKDVKATKLADNKYYKVVACEPINDDTTNFEFRGIDDGKYVLVETTIPKGYNAVEAEEFEIVAGHDYTAVDPQLLTFTADPFTASKEDGNITTPKGNTHDIESGEAYAEIENNSGSVLPETGGIGTTILYTLGGILVVGAGVLLVARRKMER